jgi:hypothetical protein
VPSDPLTLGDIVARFDTLVVACTRCDHQARHPVTALIARYGSQFLLWDVLSVLSQGCPAQETVRPDAPCGIYYPDLPSLD